MDPTDAGLEPKPIGRVESPLTGRASAPKQGHEGSPVWIEPYPDDALKDGRAGPAARYEQRESVELAFVASLQHLPGNQRAALILREVVGLSAREAAESLETSEASVNSALQRARKTVDEKLPDQSQQVTLRSLGDDQLRIIVQGYMDALERGDDAMVGMVTEDATWSMPPMPGWFAGREAIAGFLSNHALRDQGATYPPARAARPRWAATPGAPSALATRRPSSTS